MTKGKNPSSKRVEISLDETSQRSVPESSEAPGFETATGQTLFSSNSSPSASSLISRQRARSCAKVDAGNCEPGVSFSSKKWASERSRLSPPRRTWSLTAMRWRRGSGESGLGSTAKRLRSVVPPPMSTTSTWDFRLPPPSASKAEASFSSQA